MSTLNNHAMDIIKVKSLNLSSYLEHENKALIPIIIGVIALAYFKFPEYLIYTIVVSALIIIIRYISLNKTYKTYSIAGKDKNYFLFSKILGSKLNTNTGQYSDMSKTSENYLEEFLSDFNNKCDWGNSNEVNSYKQILSHLTYAHIPNKSNNKFTLPEMNEQVEYQYTALMENLNNKEEIKQHVGDLYKTLSSIDSKRSTYNMEKSNSNLGNLL